MVADGATTLWEAWDGDAHHIGETPLWSDDRSYGLHRPSHLARLAGSGGTSRNHIMFGGGVNRFLAKAVGGVPAEPTTRLQLGPAPVRDEGREVTSYPE